MLFFSLFPLIQSTLRWNDLNVATERFGPHLIAEIPRQLQEKRLKKLDANSCWTKQKSPNIESMKDVSTRGSMKPSTTESNRVRHFVNPLK
jgi:hypothetical protein